MSEITFTTVTGKGTATNPYIINSTQDFLFMSKQTFSSKYIELASAIVLNDETFDENGLASGGDGNVYTWQPITTWTKCYFNGNDHVVSGIYFNDRTTTKKIGLFNCELSKIENVKVKDVYLCGKTYVCAVSAYESYSMIMDNVHNLGGYIKADRIMAGVSHVVAKMTNCINRVENKY